MRKSGRWTIADAAELYGIDAWGRDFLTINDSGHLEIRPKGGKKPGIDLKELVDAVAERGIGLPLLIRFSDLVKARIDAIHGAFHRAIKDYGYQGQYRGVYPIKVNQDSLLVRDLVEFGRRFHYGLEAGSKPELMAVMAMLRDEEALVVCNGYKDEEYVETALLASQLGPKVVLVAEKPQELELISRVARRVGVRPRIGIRSRLATRGAGHWESSGGDRSKFGFGAREVIEAVDYLRGEEILDCFELLHFHLGSQISSIRNVKDALREAGWIYANLVRMGVPLLYLDVGGGLGVDYDGSQTNFTSSMNYSLQEYANDVIYGVMEVCDQAEVRHPTIVTESGRATVAHHAVLVVEVLGLGEFRVGDLPEKPPEDASPLLAHLFDAHRELTAKNLRETYHDVLQYRDECLTLFNLGHLSLEHRVLAEDIFWDVCRRVRDLLRDLPRVPPELEGIEQAISDTFFCNFSVFQSVPDSWAIDQLFPVAPIHRLDEVPERRGVLADITCDSDGKIDRFIDPREVRRVLELHAPKKGEPYYLAIFLVGAYQEILGDLHNLFGDTNTVHVSLAEDGDYEIEDVVAGDTVSEVLRYVNFAPDDLVSRVRRLTERAIRAGRIDRQRAAYLLKFYQDGLAGYTYLEA